ncbi:MAG TPA: DUF86 domain-containing protein [Bacteroidales bacterium]|nr:DUF86 domain-containing protein [Bacteroidales bacterium]HNQ83038.1 DUF86 domain-containing protein [Bacteroidales bacterium]HOX78997.1 DUF86 domain-containing protein [Bacteroidales bacterium]HPI86134.1 DUF86 domain-containing protein [Bacteroidales bacterium]HPM91638.1 DUF86 domain-containing protein [Bacteroidales bacterium]
MVKEFPDLERLKHISEATGKILHFCRNKSEDDFIKDEMLNSSVLYQFIIIGETIRYINPELLAKYDYPWHLPKSFRNYIANEYFGINLKQVYKTVTDLLPEFKELIDKMIDTITMLNF